MNLEKEKLTTTSDNHQPHSGVEGEAPTALPTEGATRAPVITKGKLAGDLKAHLQFLQSMGVQSVAKGCAGTGGTGGGFRAGKTGRHAGLPASGTTPGDRPRSQLPDKSESLDDIRADVGDCRRCKLCNGRKNIVFGVGNPHAELMFIGEGPGADEDEQGEPFVGRAGQLLTKIIGAMGLTRDEVYINNIVMCRPPGNRVPEPDEVASCKPFLMRRIAAINPKVIVCLGATAVQNLLEREVKITQIRGTWIDWAGRQLMPTFHPAYLLRNPAAKKEVWDDMKEVLRVIGKPIPTRIGG